VTRPPSPVQLRNRPFHDPSMRPAHTSSYEGFARIWPGRDHPWAARLNTIKKYVFSSTLDDVQWQNSVLISTDAVQEVTKLKDQTGGDLLIYGHGRLTEALLHHRLIDLLDLSVHPVLLGAGQPLFRQGQSQHLKLAATRSFTNIVKLTHEPAG
jgi:dihydrofolate reductase